MDYAVLIVFAITMLTVYAMQNKPVSNSDEQLMEKWNTLQKIKKGGSIWEQNL